MFHKNRLDGMWESDIIHGRTNSLDGNIHAQVFSNGIFFAEIYSMSRKADAVITLKNSSQRLEFLNASLLMFIMSRTHLAQSL